LRPIPSAFHVIALAAAVVACSRPADRIEITETSTRSETRPVPQVNASSDDRFYYARPRDARMPGVPEAQSATAGEVQTPPEPDATLAAASTSMFSFETPPGWQQIAASQFRDPNFIIGPTGEIECYVSVLGGGGGGLFTNANRWRAQMGRSPYTEEEFARLPRATILGQEAVIVDFPGDFSGMGGAETKTGHRLVGALIQAPNAAIFIKMIGPDAAVEAEKDNFALFAQSLRMAQEQPEPVREIEAVEAPSPAPPPGASASGAGGFEWTAPEGWTVDPSGSAMRLVTYRFGPQNVGECYVSVMPGAAGGRLENFNRWLAQMGEPPLVETELELQPTVFLFGEELPMLITSGTYTGMGNEARAGSVMYGAISTVGDQSVFVKLIAPEQIAGESLQQFQRFCASIQKQ